MAVAVLEFIYSSYKYLFYSADCNPSNKLSICINSFFSLLAIVFDYYIWLIPVILYFWLQLSEKKMKTHTAGLQREHEFYYRYKN